MARKTILPGRPHLFSPRRARFLAGLGTAIAIGAAAAVACQAGLFHGAQVSSTDFLFRAADAAGREGSYSDDVVIVAVDDSSLEELGRVSSWPRSLYATVTRKLSTAGARVIAYDLLFSEAGEGDNSFAAAMGLAGNVVLPIVETSGLLTDDPTGSRWSAYGTYEHPIAALEERAAAIGHANVVPDADGVVRRLPFTLPSEDGNIQAFSVSAAALYLEQPHALAGCTGGMMDVAGRQIPLDAAGLMEINYSTAVGPHRPQQVSFTDVLQGTVDPAVFNDKVVLIGATAVGLQDAFWTPCGRMMSGVEIHGSAIQTIVSGETLTRASPNLVAFLALMFAFIAGLAATRLTTTKALAAVTATLVLYILAVFVAFDHGILLDMLYPPASLAASFSGAAVYNAASERARRNHISATFGRFVSTPVALEILAALDNGTVTLGATQRDVTVLFADIRGFTAMAERLDPPDLVQVVNAYVSLAVTIIEEEGGMVNKFGGDSVMAVWNAPTDCADHAVRALTAALRIQKQAAALPETNPALPAVRFGIGVNTGSAVVGNFGAEQRLEYSVLGDTVNVAARITALAPGGTVWITSATKELVADKALCKDLGAFSLRGKESLVQLYEATPVIKRSPGDRRTMPSSEESES